MSKIYTDIWLRINYQVREVPYGKVLTLSQKYVLLDQLLFKLIMIPDREKALLAIPELCADKIISLYYDSLFAGHQRVIKTYLMIE